jgi:hypothetical protein
MSTTQRERYEVMRRLQGLGISYDDAYRLRRVSMTLQRWFELECGDGNDYGSWAIEREESDYWKCLYCKERWYHPDTPKTPYTSECAKHDNKQHRVIRVEATNLPYMVHHHYLHGHGKDYTTRTRIADKETGARKRLAKMMEKYPDLAYYIQTDPRGCALYILSKEDREYAATHGYALDQIYNRGVAVY